MQQQNSHIKAVVFRLRCKILISAQMLSAILIASCSLEGESGLQLNFSNHSNEDIRIIEIISAGGIVNLGFVPKQSETTFEVGIIGEGPITIRILFRDNYIEKTIYYSSNRWDSLCEVSFVAGAISSKCTPH